MNQIHPIMADALAPFMPRRTDTVSELMARINLLNLALRLYKAPVPDAGMYVYEWRCDRLDEPVVCHLEYTAPEAATDVSPGQRESIDLMYAYFRGGDVYGLLSSEDATEIENAALAQMRAEAEQAKEPI